MKLIDQIPDMPITEDWAWQTDIHIADDGSEQRVMLSPLPKRTLRTSMVYDTEGDIQRMMLAMFAFGEPYLLPFYHQACRLKQPSWIGDNVLIVNTGLSDLREGEDALLYDRLGNRAVVRCEAVTATEVTLTAPLTASWPVGAHIAPLWAMYPEGQASFRRPSANGSGSVSLVSKDVGFMDPFLSELVDVELVTFNGLPVLEVPATGTEFEMGIETGAEWFDYGGVVDNRNRRQHAQLLFPRNYLCQRIFQPSAWHWWRAFADYAKGSLNPFYVSTARQDFAVHTAAAPNGNTFVFAGEDYADDWAPFPAFQSFEIVSSEGTQYVEMTGVEKVGGNSVVTFAPALPNVAGWATDQRISLLLKARIADDTVSCEHHALHTMVSLNLRTVDE